MRNKILTACCLLATASFQVHAQEPDDTEDAASETEGAEVVDEPSTGVRSTPGGADSAPGETHNVARGDTLWDLSQKYLGSPWYWPKVWSYNPEIANPHWIYPGNQVKFYPSGEGGPSRIDVSNPDGEEGAIGPSATAIDDGGGSDLMVTEDEVDNTVQVSGPIGYQNLKAPSRIVSEGFVTPREVEEAGKIKASFKEADMLTYLDEVYLTFKGKAPARVGDRFVIFRPMGTLSHPRRMGNVGHVTKILGSLRITRLNEKVVTAVIEQALDDIVRGDLVGPVGEAMAQSLRVQPNKTEVHGFVVGALTPLLTIYGEHHVIVVDKGAADGVQAGNTFTVVRQGDRGGGFLDPSKGQDKDMPLEDVGACMALDVKERASTCILVRSLREIVPGDRLIMRPATAPVAQR